MTLVPAHLRRLLVGALAPLGAGAVRAPAADAAVPGRAPAELRLLPPVVRTALAARGCRVPRDADVTGAARTVVHAALTAPGSDDWAVLCVIGRRQRVVVVPGARGARVTVFGDAPADDGTRIWRVEAATIRDWPERVVATVAPASALELDAAERRAIGTHDGIGMGGEDGPADLWVFTGRRWVAFSDGD